MPSLSSGNGRIVVCDDHEATLRLLAIQLRDYDVGICQTRAELFAELRPDTQLLLLDIHLEGREEGIEIVREIRSLPQLSHLKIYAFTACPTHSDPERVRKLGFDGLLGKPFQKQELLNLLNSRELTP